MIAYGKQTIEQNDIDVINDILHGKWLTQGPAVKKFEEDLVVGVEGVPWQDWECRYCQYYSICPSTLADKKPRY